ncbi:retinoblastoma-associated protein isoform X2 [Denticeps clupeoides]|uniref:retinoblastoma-associated protein isoform X2 n=1 Tax=Denticeps clupeoides TaxID=299321 RepID=UPI0010A2C00E|nr:retinoblastoma-associated protein isoform X2 [Denticeps clupeoides]
MPPKKRSAVSPKSGAKGSKCSNKDVESRLSAEKHEDKDTGFVALCMDLMVTDAVCDQAWIMWKKVSEAMDKIPDTTSHYRRIWGACLFLVVTDMGVVNFTFSDILKALDLNVKQFINLLRMLDVNVDTISPKVNGVLSRLEKKYNVSLALYQRFEKTCKRIYSETSVTKSTMRSSWLMFLLAKGRVLQMEDDLVIAFQLLLCVLEFFIKRSSPADLQPLYKSAVNPPTRTSRRCTGKAKVPSQEMDMQLLESLCKENECSVDEVRNIYQTSFSAFLDSSRFSGSQELPEMEDLSKEYEELYLINKDFDARLFLDDDGTLSPELMDLEMTPKKIQSDEEQTRVPPQTPIRATLNSIRQLRVDLTSAGDHPSDNLIVFFKNCTVDPSDEIMMRVEQLGQVFGQRFAQAVGHRCLSLGKQRFALGVCLYYRVMESMLKSEEERLSVHNFSKLLNNSSFHTSLLACALEVVMATYAGNSFRTAMSSSGSGNGTLEELDLCFPWILDVFQLSAFDFYKVIESFIKAEPSLSRDMVKHLERCEHQIIESTAWRDGSPLFELLRQSCEEYPVEQAEATATLSQPLQHSHTAADLYLSPVRVSVNQPMPVDSTTSDAATTLNPSTPTTKPSIQSARQLKSNSLTLFYKKLYRMAYLRLKELCARLLAAHPELEPIIWTLLQHTLQNEYDLMRDRHLDQLMMSAIYAICKVKSVDLRFKTIVTEYKQLPNTDQETFKRVLIRDSQYDSIIVFYNLVFMQKLKTNILQYSSPRPPPLSPIPHIPCSPYKYPNSPLRVPGSNNVYISPMKGSRSSPGVMTPQSRILVSIGPLCFVPNIESR